LTTWENLLESVSHIGPLTTNPLEARGMISRVNVDVDPQEIIEKKLERKRRRNRNKRRRNKNNPSNNNNNSNNR
jgi:hypothetical protein